MMLIWCKMEGQSTCADGSTIGIRSQLLSKNVQIMGRVGSRSSRWLRNSKVDVKKSDAVVYVACVE